MDLLLKQEEASISIDVELRRALPTLVPSGPAWPLLCFFGRGPLLLILSKLFILYLSLINATLGIEMQATRMPDSHTRP